ncbi:hypothetical protein KAH43_06230 [Candidatus Bipolaricaulota bacterium]|nr:hypothetical protein [Candidatus Bipolaricaulota bacterium]
MNRGQDEKRPRSDAMRTVNPLAALLLRFIGIFVMALILLALAWPVIAPATTQLATRVARMGFHIVESPNVSVLEARGDELWVHRIVGPGQIKPFTWFDRYTFFALIPLIALFAATPGLGLIQRFVRLAISLVLLFLIQTSYVVVSVQLTYAAIGLTSVGPLAARMLDGWQLLVRVLWEAAPLVLWVACTASTWTRRLREIREGQKDHREAQAKGIRGLRTEARKGCES